MDASWHFLSIALASLKRKSRFLQSLLHAHQRRTHSRPAISHAASPGVLSALAGRIPGTGKGQPAGSIKQESRRANPNVRMVRWT